MTGHLISRLVPYVVCLAVLWFTAGGAAAQESRTLNVGTLLYETNSAMSSDDMLWPRDLPFGGNNNIEMLETYGVIIGAPRTWTDPLGVTRDIQIAQIAQNKFSDVELVTPPVPGAFFRAYRYPYPDKVLDGFNWADFQARNDSVAADLPSAVMIKNHLESWTGIDIQRWAYAFANEEYDDLVILEHLFTNTSDETLSNVYFGVTAEMHAHTYYPADLWGTYYGATYAQFVAGDPAADSLRVFYSWDADETSGNPTIDTRGKPESDFGYFREPQYAAIAVLHADESAEDESDDPTQPWKAGWSQRELAPDLNVAGHEDIYEYLSGGWDPNNPGTYAVTIDAEGDVVSGRVGPYRILDPAIDINNTTQFDPLTEQEKTALLSFGPYTLEPGQDIRIVTAFAAGSIPERWAIDVGRAYENGVPAQLTAPLPYDVTNPFTGEVIARAGTMVDKETKNEILDLSREFTLRNVSRAKRAWEGGNVRAGQGDFDVPLAPAAPSLTAFSEGDQVRLTWEDNNVGTDQDLIGWRIYRDFKRPSELELPTDTTFLMLAGVPGDGKECAKEYFGVEECPELPPSQTEYIDRNVTRGEQYYYYIVAVNADSIESSPYLNRTGVTSIRENEALTARQPALENDWQNQVVVVPNPYHVQAAVKYPGERLNFLNLPAYARIHIYTMTGDRIQTLDHDVNAGDEDWLEQDTFSTMEIVSGVYIFVVEKLDGPGGSPNGEQATGKFVVIK